MTTPEPQPAIPSPRPRFQFTLRTLLLLFVVLGSSLAVFGGWGILVFGLVVVLAVYLHHAKRLLLWGHFVLVAFCGIGGSGWFLWSIPNVARHNSRWRCDDNLRQIALALQAYHRENGRFPPAYIANKHGKAMHSWRVLLLPYIGRSDLYEAYDFSQPWNGPKNEELLTRRPDVSECPRALRSSRAIFSDKLFSRGRPACRVGG